MAFTSQIYTQYFAIPLIALAIYWNFKFAIYTLITFLLFLVDGDQLNIRSLSEYLGWNLRYTRIAFLPLIILLIINFIEIMLGEKKIKFYIQYIKRFVSKKV